jgi:hypothetical protein
MSLFSDTSETSREVLHSKLSLLSNRLLPGQKWRTCRRRVTWILHREMIEAKVFGTFITLYSIFKSERLSANIKPTLHKALIRSIMTYASPAWEVASDTHLMKLQRLQKKNFRTIVHFPILTPVRDLCMVFKIP